MRAGRSGAPEPLRKVVMNGSTNPRDVLASMLTTHMQIEALGLCAAMSEIEKFSDFYLSADDPPPLNVLFRAVVEFAVLCTRKASEAHLQLAGGVLGINVDADSQFFQKTVEEAGGKAGYLLAVIFNTGGVKDKEVDYYMNQKGPLSRFISEEE